MDILEQYNQSNRNLCNANLIGANLIGANLRGVDLRGANLYDADLRGADLCNANLIGANLIGTDLCGVDLRGANLYDADLRGADLCGANLRYANLRYADLSSADLCGADLSYANLRGASLRYADLRDVRANHFTAGYYLVCPEEGGFIGFKKASGYVVKLQISEHAKRSSATTLKCRCSEAKVLAIYDLDGNVANKTEVPSDYSTSFVYKVGEIVVAEDFDEDRWNECSTGIHFFMSFELAKSWI